MLHCGCGTYQRSQSSAEAFTQNRPSDASEGALLAVDDTIEVSVEVDGNMEVSHHQSRISYQGLVTLPLIGDVEIVGLKLDRARNVIAEKYNRYYVNPPVIMISLVDANELADFGSVSVLGKVGSPGLVPISSRRGLKLSAAVQAAGGFSPSAKVSRIRITRMGENGQKIQTTVDFEQIGQEGNAEVDLNLIDGDIVYVPERIF
jgi:protein involved in polysaccharide export with SLBB domain